MRLKPLPGDYQSGQERQTTEANGDGESGLEAMHVRDKNSRKFLRCEDVAKLRGASGNQLRSMDTRSGHG